MRRWLLLVGYVGLLYASLPWTRDVLVALYQLELVGALVTVVYFAAAVLLAWYVVFDVRLTDKAAFVALVVLGGVVGALVLGLAIPEERLHFLQYGLLAVLARRALAQRFAPAWQYASAIAIASAVGWGDELIQGRLPGRVYDVRDVLNNALAAVFAMAGAEALHNRLGWRSAEAQR